MNSSKLNSGGTDLTPALIKAIDDCTTISQLFTLIRREGITVQMHAQSDASNVTARKLPVPDDSSTPLERFKEEIKKSLMPQKPTQPVVSGYQSKRKAELVKAINESSSLSQLFALIQLEGISINMQSQSDASSIRIRKLSPKEIIDKKDLPFERLKQEVLKAVERM